MKRRRFLQGLAGLVGFGAVAKTRAELDREAYDRVWDKAFAEVDMEDDGVSYLLDLTQPDAHGTVFSEDAVADLVGVAGEAGWPGTVRFHAEAGEPLRAHFEFSVTPERLRASASALEAMGVRVEGL